MYKNKNRLRLIQLERVFTGLVEQIIHNTDYSDIITDEVMAVLNILKLSIDALGST